MQIPINELVSKAVQTAGTLDASRTKPTLKKFSDASKWSDRWLRLKITSREVARLVETMTSVAEQFASSPHDGKLVVIYGHYGTGKTHAAKAMVNWVMQCNTRFAMQSNRLVDAWFYRWPEVVSDMKDGDWSLPDAIVEHTLCALDDIGAEHDPSKIGIEKLGQILNHRERKWTIVTTNVLPKDWPAKFDNRIASRLIRNAIGVNMTQAKDFSTL